MGKQDLGNFPDTLYLALLFLSRTWLPSPVFRIFGTGLIHGSLMRRDARLILPGLHGQVAVDVIFHDRAAAFYFVLEVDLISVLAAWFSLQDFESVESITELSRIYRKTSFSSERSSLGSKICIRQ